MFEIVALVGFEAFGEILAAESGGAETFDRDIEFFGEGADEIMNENLDVLVLGQRRHDFQPPIVVGHAKGPIAHFAQKFLVKIPAYVFQQEVLDAVERRRLV